MPVGWVVGVAVCWVVGVVAVLMGWANANFISEVLVS